VGADFILITRVLVDVWRNQYGITFFVRWQGDRSFNLGPGALGSLYDFAST
jgi:hypothetical protein